MLVRVDEYPHARSFDPASSFGDDGYRRFHEVLTEAGIPYLLAISPRVSRDYLDPAVVEDRGLEPAEQARLRALAADGVIFALHGCNHRTRYSSPRRKNESSAGSAPRRPSSGSTLPARPSPQLGIETPVFVPPFNRFDASQYGLLADRFEIVCAGPESTRLLGFQPTPAWWGKSVYLPSYPPLYGTAAQALEGVERLAAMQAGLWAPLTLHWGWELEDGFAALKRLCKSLQGRASHWSDFLAAVRSVSRISASQG